MLDNGFVLLDKGNTLYNVFNDLLPAIDMWNHALQYFIKYHYREGEGTCYGNIGSAYSGLNQHQKAIEYLNKALEIAIERRDMSVEGTCYGNIGSAYSGLNQHQKAIEYLNKALEIAMKIGERQGEGICNRDIGSAYHNLGQHQKAIEYLNKALEIAIERRDTSVEVTCYGNIGSAYHNLGQYEISIKYYNKVLEIFTEIGNIFDERTVGGCYINIGILYSKLDRPQKAIEYYNKALEIDKKTSSRPNGGSIYLNLGGTVSSNQPQKAIEYYNKALEIAIEKKNRRLELRCYASLGLTHNYLHQYKDALDYHNKALEIATDMEYRSDEGRCYSDLGLAYEKLDQPQKAIEYHNKALEISMEVDDVFEKMRHYISLGEIYYELSQYKDAYQNLVKSINIREFLGGNFVEEEHMIRFYGRNLNQYDLMINTCTILGKNREAFEYAERSKSKAFLSLISTNEILPKKYVPQKLLQKEHEFLIRKKHIRIEQKINLGQVPKIELIQTELNAIYDEIKEYDEEYTFLRKGKILSLKTIQNLLNDDTILIEYFVTNKKLFIFTLTQSKQEKPIVIDISSKELQNSINEYRNEIMKCTETTKNEQHLPEDLTNMNKIIQKIGNTLIEPISELLRKPKKIIFVPHSILHSIPLHSLPLNGIPLGIIKAVLYLPHASLLNFTKKENNISTLQCISFWADQNEESRDTIINEAKTIAQLFDTSEQEITKEKFRNLANNNKTGIIHLSCHGVFDPKDPLSSFIVLAGNDHLTAKEIYNLKLDCDLLTISACETGVNEIKPGDESMGLSRAILYAGARSTLLSLWEVESNATQELMVRFYKNIKSGQNTAIALQNAQKYIMNFRDGDNKKIYKHPFFWSAFILVGNV